MAVQSALLLTSPALAALLGFAAHRASICTVKAVEEILTTRRAFMLLCFAKTVLWIIAATALLVWALPDAGGQLAGWQLTLTGLAGGVLFGVGAVFNKGCAFSTLTRLGDGQLAMLASLAGFALGVVGYGLVDPPAPVPAELGIDTYIAQAGLWPRLGLAVLLVWSLWETWRLWRTRPTGGGLRTAALAERYRLSTAALLLGVSNAVLYALHGLWPYTTTLALGVRQAMGAEVRPGTVAWLLLVFVVAGMVASARQRRSFRLRWRPEPAWLSYLMGGALMGFGAAMVPGGNDVLILHGIPILSPHALPAYLAMLAGIALTLSLLRLAGMELDIIDCSGDLCRR